MRLADFEEVVALWQSTPGVGLSDSDSRPNIARYLRRNPGMSLVARSREGELVGAVLSGHDGRRGYLHHLAVAVPWRKKGIGRQLVDRCLQNLARAAIPKCNIFLYAHNAEGERFWRRVGWNGREDLRMLQKVTSGAKASRGSSNRRVPSIR